MNAWERVNCYDDDGVTQRLRVFGGWLLLTTVEFEHPAMGCGTQYTIAQSFVPDLNHEWVIEGE